MKYSIYIFILLSLTGCSQNSESNDEYKDLSYAEQGKAEIIKMLRDPDSAQFGDTRVSRKQGPPVICGTVNSRNGFGGMTGRFIAAPGVMSVIEGENMTASEFSGSWNQFCS
jgi:hypothetical protein